VDHLLDISDLIFNSTVKGHIQIINWLGDCISPIESYFMPWPACEGSGWQLKVVSYDLQLAYPDIHMRAWALICQEYHDIVMFKIRWL
jgi:hypothetical protein